MKWNNFLDRSLALLNEKNEIITQRSHPQLSLIKIQLNNDEIILNAPKMETLKISYHSYCSDKLITFKIWGQETQGNFKLDKFIFHKFFKIRLRLWGPSWKMV